MIANKCEYPPEFLQVFSLDPHYSGGVYSLRVYPFLPRSPPHTPTPDTCVFSPLPTPAVTRSDKSADTAAARNLLNIAPPFALAGGAGTASPQMGKELNIEGGGEATAVLGQGPPNLPTTGAAGGRGSGSGAAGARAMDEPKDGGNEGFPPEDVLSPGKGLTHVDGNPDGQLTIRLPGQDELPITEDEAGNPPPPPTLGGNAVAAGQGEYPKLGALCLHCVCIAAELRGGASAKNMAMLRRMIAPMR